MTLTLGSLFSGYGGLDLGIQDAFGARTVWHSEIDTAACRVLAHRYPHVPNLGDITTVDWAQVQPVDIIAGGSPCQDLSVAGRRAGMHPGTRSGLWDHMAHAIRTLQPSYVVWENVPGALYAHPHTDRNVERHHMGLPPSRSALPAAGRVAGDLASLGYDTTWTTLRASDLGACHHRNRLFLLAWRTHYLPTTRTLGDSTPPTRTPLLPTPRAADEHASPGAPAANRHAAQGIGSLGEVLGLHLPTPTASLGRPGGGTGMAGRRQAGHTMGLHDALAEHTTPHQTGEEFWGPYYQAIVHHTAFAMRLPPKPLLEGPRGGLRLNPAFVEWMMCLPKGWVTDLVDRGRITWRDALRILGNGVLPTQAHHALHHLIHQKWPKP